MYKIATSVTRDLLLEMPRLHATCVVGALAGPTRTFHMHVTPTVSLHLYLGIARTEIRRKHPRGGRILLRNEWMYFIREEIIVIARLIFVQSLLIVVAGYLQNMP